MKITQASLKRIIQEETKKLQKERRDFGRLGKWEKDSPAYKPPGISKWLPWRQDDIADNEQKQAKQLDLEEQIRNAIEEFDSIASANKPDVNELYDLQNTVVELYRQLPARKRFIADEHDRLYDVWSTLNDESEARSRARSQADKEIANAAEYKAHQEKKRRDAESSYTPSRSRRDDYDPEFKNTYLSKGSSKVRGGRGYSVTGGTPWKEGSNHKGENKLTKGALKRMIKEETKNLRKEGFMDWFKGKKEEPAIEPEAQGDPEAAAEAYWQALEDEFREVYRGVTDGVPHLDDCRSMECEKLIKKFWLMWEEVKPSPERRQEYISTYVEGGPKAAQKLVNDTWYFGDPSFRHNAGPDGSFRVDTKWVKELELQKMFINNALKSFQNPSQPEPEPESRDDSYYGGGDMRGLSRRNRERTPGGGSGLTRENKATKKALKRMIQQEMKLLKNKKGNI